MSFLNIWWAAAVAAVVVPALLILYFLKLRRRELLISSTLLWKRAVQDLQVNAPFQRLRKNLLLFLQLLVLAAAVFALGRPIIQTAVADEERVVLLIDRSASMNVREGNDSRLDQAKEQATRLVRTFNQRAGGWRSFLSLSGAKTRTQVMLIAFSDRASIISPFTSNTTDLVERIQGIERTDGRTDMSEALDLAEAYMAPPRRTTDKTPVSAEKPAKLILISDGRVANLDKLVLRSGTLELVRVGETRDNLGITTLRTQRNYEQPESLDIFLTVRNFGSGPAETDVSVFVDGTLRSVQPVKLSARPAAEAATSQPTTREARSDDTSARSLSFGLMLDRAAVVEAKLSRADALAADNAAYAVVPPPRRQRVLVVTEGRYPFLHDVIAGLPLLEYPFVTPAGYEAGNGGPYAVDGKSTFDVVIFDKYVPDKLPSGNYMFLGAIPKLKEIEVSGKLEKHALIWWDETNPVLRHVSLDYVYVGESQTVKVPRQAEVMVEGPQGPVLFRYAADGRQYLVLTFPIERSTWVSKLSFPVFVYNAIRYLGGGDAEAERGPVRPGETLRVPIPPGTDKLRLLRPDDSRATLVPDASGVAYYGGTERVGVYRAENGVPGFDRFAVNLEDDWESDVAPPSSPLKVGAAPVVELAAIKTATPEVWRWFIGAALALMLIEWWVYNRRVML